MIFRWSDPPIRASLGSGNYFDILKIMMLWRESRGEEILEKGDQIFLADSQGNDLGPRQFGPPEELMGRL